MIQWQTQQQCPKHVQDWVQSHPQGSIFQSPLWAALWGRIPGVREVQWIWGSKEERMVVAMMVVRIGLPFGGSWCYVGGGPLWCQETPLAELVPATMNYMDDWAQAHKCWWTRWEMSYEHDTLGSLMEKQWKRSVVSYQPEASLVLDCTMTEEAVLAQMKPKGRYNIRLAEKKGVQVQQWHRSQGKWVAVGGHAHPIAEPLEEFYRVFQETTARDGFAGRKYGYYMDMMELLGEQGVLLLALHEGDVLAGGIFSFYETKAIYHFGASSQHKRNVMAPYLIQWKAIQESQHRGMELYDFLGISPAGVEGHSWEQVTTFKKKFGGTELQYVGAWEHAYRPLWIWIVSLAKVLRRWLPR